MFNPNDATIDILLTTVNSEKEMGTPKDISHASHATCRSTIEFARSSINVNSGQSKSSSEGRPGRMEMKVERKNENADSNFTSPAKLYTAVSNFSVVIRYLIYAFPLALVIAAPIVIGATVSKKVTIGGVRIVWFFTWIEILWLSLWFSKLIAQLLPHTSQFLSKIGSSDNQKYFLILTALEMPLSLAGWVLTALTTFIPLMCSNPDQLSQKDTEPKYWELVIKDILFAAFFSTLVFLTEKLLIQFITASYRRTQFDDKIKQSNRNINFLSLLYDASRSLFPTYCPKFAAEDEIIHNPLKLKGNRRSGFTRPMRLIQNVGRVGDKLTAAFGDIAHEITGKEGLNPKSAHSIILEALKKRKSSEALARRIWMSLVIKDKMSLYQKDFTDYLGPDRSQEAEGCFHFLDRDGNGDVSLDEMVLTISEFGKERYAMINSIHDIDQAIKVLDELLCTVVFVTTVFIFVTFIDKSITRILMTAGTAFLSLSFIFAITAQEVLGSCIFLFVKHPYDVGDRVDISGNQLVVERISLLFTIFRNMKDNRTTQVPNVLLNSNWIDNLTRSKPIHERVFLYIRPSTTLDDIQQLRNEISKFVLEKDNSRDFQPNINVELTDFYDMNKLELQVEIQHKSSWTNEAARAARRSKFMCALVVALRKVPIYGPGAGAACSNEPANTM